MSEADFKITTPLGWEVRFSAARWRIISEIKHPVIAPFREEIIATLSNPDEIRQSKQDAEVFLFYKSYKEKRWFCAVARGAEPIGFLITAYQTSAIKTGDRIWPK